MKNKIGFIDNKIQTPEKYQLVRAITPNGTILGFYFHNDVLVTKQGQKKFTKWQPV